MSARRNGRAPAAGGDGWYKLRAMTANSVRPQWMALRFFARANPFSRTPSALRGNFKRQPAALQHKPFKALEAGGVLGPTAIPRRTGESVSLRLTSKGKKKSACTRFRSRFWWRARRFTGRDRANCDAFAPACTKCCPTLATSGAPSADRLSARTARTSAERCAATCRARAPRPA